MEKSINDEIEHITKELLYLKHKDEDHYDSMCVKLQLLNKIHREDNRSSLTGNPNKYCINSFLCDVVNQRVIDCLHIKFKPPENFDKTCGFDKISVNDIIDQIKSIVKISIERDKKSGLCIKCSEYGDTNIYLKNLTFMTTMLWRNIDNNPKILSMLYIVSECK